jgi:nitroreductase
MDILDAIALRRSVREYRPDPVPEEILMALLDAAHQAPSSWNLQPWEFVIVRSDEAKNALAGAVTPNNVNIVKTGAAIFVCLGSMRQQDALADRLEQLWITPDATPERVERSRKNLQRLREDQQWRHDHVLTNTYIGIAQLVLAAQKFGLGSVWMGGFDSDKVKAALGIPADYLVASLVTVGWPLQESAVAPRKRRPIEEIYSFDRFGQKSPM